MKPIKQIFDIPSQHWVGDGFPVRSLLSYHRMEQAISPFLLLDRGGPYVFSPATTPRGVGQHPHRGFETVTIVYEGEVAHKDSTGQGGVIGAGDVQWMTAASGIIHQEFHSLAYTKSGGMFDMVQLWVNLPAKHKMDTPAYQAIVDADIPHVTLPNHAGVMRIIGGTHGEIKGAAHTFSPMTVADIRLNAHAAFDLTVPSGWNTILVVLHGTVTIADQKFSSAQSVLLEQEGTQVRLQAHEEETLVLLLSGEPLNEPISGYGPFVMNTKNEIAQAFEDYENGTFGTIAR